ncbi:MAG: Zn-dependent exopeptidase M28 [Treponema sp.]|jgi:hypothetical protein|nr:Zn-dependent exopeptidase M28 [Treponema sp.]
MKSWTNRDWTRERPYERFFDFIAPDADRFQILREHVKGLGLNSVVIPIKGNYHFFIFPAGYNLKPSTGGVLPFRGQSPVILVAHYDRVPGSPGANDNSAAVFQLLKTALRLGEQGVDYWIIIFTDKEELEAGEGIQEQGAFGLAEKLKSCGLGEARVFNFDACGTGDTFVFSSTSDYLLARDQRPGLRRVKQVITALREHALGTARYLRLNQVLSIPTPFSDDAGFLRAGFPAQTVTILPAGEASALAMMLQNQPGFADFLISSSSAQFDRMLLPETWRCLNSPSDNHDRLTPCFFDKIVLFAIELCRGWRR